MRWWLRVVGVAMMWVDAGNAARGFFFLGTTSVEWTSEWTRCNLRARWRFHRGAEVFEASLSH